ncbi:hypothetical protein L4C54_10115 [Vibrio lamellibrachiae]|uniref:hypothetical protein n=1 Tax=Vibrio lamellibrachiae TaxID=2910253 RepID=UPI003D0E0CA0
MGYEEDYFRAPSGLPEREVRALFSDLSNLVLWEEENENTQADAMDVLRNISQHDRYQSQAGKWQTLFAHDYKATCSWWEEDWRYSQGWPLIEPLLSQFQ